MIEIKIASSPAETDACLSIRHKVFVGEQNVPEALERDEYDATGATHFLGLVDGQPLGTGRLRAIEKDGEPLAKVQRVAVLPQARGTGLGAALMRAMENHARHTALAQAVVLSAQTSAAGFYERLGYRRLGDVYQEAGIPHVDMRLDLPVVDAARRGA